MPKLSAWFIRASLLHLALGFTFGGLLLFNKGIPFYPAMWRLLPAHIELVIFGWITQLVMGMAFWILPRFYKSPVRGNEKLAWLALILLNSGIGLLVLAPIFGGASWFSFAGRLAQAGGVATFAAHAWPRVKAN